MLDEPEPAERDQANTTRLETSYWAANGDEPVLDTTIATILRRAAALAPDTTGLVEGTEDREHRRRFTYSELLFVAERTAERPAAQFDKGERVPCFAPSVPEDTRCLLCDCNGGTGARPGKPGAPPRRARLRARAVRGVRGRRRMRAPRSRPSTDRDARNANAPTVRVVMQLDELVNSNASVQDAPTLGRDREPRPEDTAQLVYTSGTTGLPKGARLTHKGMTNAARFGAIRFGLHPGDVYLDTMPLHHVGGQVVAFQICQQLATAVLVSGFDAGLVLELLESESATVTAGVPMMLLSLIDHPEFSSRNLSALRSVSLGGSVVPPELVRHIESTLGVRSTICFGQTETCGFISQTHLTDSAEDKASTLGQPLPCVEARVVSSAATEANPEAQVEEVVLGCGEVGELQVRSPYVMAGYHDMPEATDSAFAPGGWLRTGDLVTMDDRGFLRIAGRVKDMIVTGGENVFPVEIEAVLCEHPDVMMAAVVGVPHRKWGEQVVAVVRPISGATPDPAILTAYLRERLAPFKVPKQILVADELPLTASGKVQNFVIREQLARAETDTFQ